MVSPDVSCRSLRCAPDFAAHPASSALHHGRISESCAGGLFLSCVRSDGGEFLTSTLWQYLPQGLRKAEVHRRGDTDRRQCRGLRPEVEQLEDRVTPSVSGPPFDFSNSFYLANGIDPSQIQQRVGISTSASA